MIHLQYGGSTAARTINCPGWVNQSKNIPPAPASEHALRGSAIHALFERGMLDPDYQPEPGAVALDGGETFALSAEDIAEAVLPCYDAAEELLSTYNCNHNVEFELFVQRDAETGGSADLAALSDDGKVLVIGDVKSGGVPVYAENLEQLLFYAWLVLDAYADWDTSQVEKLALAIIQPCNRKENILDVWEVAIEKIDDFEQTMLAAIRQSKHPQAPLKAGDHCKYCPALPVCPEKTGLAAKVKRLPVDSLELETLNQAMAIVKEVEQWVKEVKKFAHQQADLGVPIRGFKLIAAQGKRTWKNPDTVEALLKKDRTIKVSEMYTKKLVSPAQLEKLFAAKGVFSDKYQEHVKFSEGTNLVPESNPKPALPAVGGLLAAVNRR